MHLRLFFSLFFSRTNFLISRIKTTCKKYCILFAESKIMLTFAPSLGNEVPRRRNMVNVAQLVRALDCGSKGRGFEPHLSPPKRQGFRKGKTDMVNVAQLVRALDCGSKGRGFEPHLSPHFRREEIFQNGIFPLSFFGRNRLDTVFSWQTDFHTEIFYIFALYLYQIVAK